MESNIEVAVRICPAFCGDGEHFYVKPNIQNNTIQVGNSRTFPVQYVLPSDCNQTTLFTTAVAPLVNYLFEGCDVSVVTFGQSGCGKSYTLLGPGLGCALSESEHGVIPRFLRDVFSNITLNSDKNYVVHITWTQICGENVQDLLGTGSAECASVSEAFDLLQMGMLNIVPQHAHTLFTVTLEQQWVIDSVVQHKISTASFIDLAGCEKTIVVDNTGLTQAVPIDTGLLTLQRCVWALTDPYASVCNPPYNQSALTMLLKDSFGGRAKTLLICCISPLLGDFMETFYTLQFGARTQMIRNYVTVNSYTTCEVVCENSDLFGLQFAANQLFKLVSNAEYLFKNLIVNSSLSKSQQEQISQWLTLKQECKDCISEPSEPHRSLDIIEEEIEDSHDSGSEESDTACEGDSIQQFEELMRGFQLKTDGLIATVNTQSSTSITKESSHSSSSSVYRLKAVRGRRGSIRSAEDLVPALGATADITEEQDVDTEEAPNRRKTDLSYEAKQKSLQQVCREIEGCEKQISELETTIQMKEKLIQQLLRHKNTKNSARDKLQQISQRLQDEHSVAQSKLLQARSENDRHMEQKYYSEVRELSQRLQEAELIKDVAGDGTKKILELENSVQSSKKQLEKLQKHKSREEKRRRHLEDELKQRRKRRTNQSNSSTSSAQKSDITQVLCSHNCVPESGDALANLKHEIKELRKTRNFLVEQISKVDLMSNRRKLLDESEERRLIQCEEAIEAVDTAIEHKNQLICGCTCASASSCSSDQEDNVVKTLMEQLMKLGIGEIRALFRKYFEKLVELRSTSKRLEQQVVEAEAQNDSLVCRIQSLSRTLQRVRLENERRVLSLRQQHEDQLQVVLRHLASGDAPDIMSHVVGRSKQAALAFQVSQTTSKHLDKGSLIARFTRYARQETVPRQLQAVITPPQAKVTRQKNKLIIQQSSK